MAKTLQAGLIALGLVLAAVAVAHADEPEPRILPAGTVIQLPRGGEQLTLTETRFLIPRPQIDRANATAELARRLEADLLACSSELAERRKPEPGWRVGLRWTLIGAAIGAAFTLGSLL
jgi:hypothetical protein